MSQDNKKVNVYVLPNSHPVEKHSSSPPWWNVDKEMLRYKLHYFLYLSALGCSLPYLVVFAKDRVGISASSLGAVLTAQMFVFIFTKPFFGYVADYFNRLKASICALAVVFCACYFLFLAIPTHPVTLAVTTAVSAASCGGNSTPAAARALVLCDNTDGCLRRCGNNGSDVVPALTYKGFVCVVLIVEGRELSQQSACSFQCMWNAIPLFEEPGYDNETSNSNHIDHICPEHDPIAIHAPTSAPSCIYNGDLSDICDLKRADDYTTSQFWLFAVIFTLLSVCSNAIFTLSDTACFESIQRTGADFGQQRLWGAIGWGAAATLSGYINDLTGDFVVSWTAMAVLLSLFLWNITKLDLVKPHFSQNILKDVGTVFKSREFLAFELSVFMNGTGTGVIWFYLIWFLTSLGGSELLYGLSLLVQSYLGVIPFMFFSKHIIKRMGHFNIMIFALACLFLRFLWYSQLHNPWLVLPVELLHGITYGLYYTALGAYAKMNAKPGTEATTQSIIFSTHEGLGAGLGCVLAGIGFDSIGSHRTFYYFSMFFAFGVVLCLVFSILLDNRTGVLRLADDADHLKKKKGLSCNKYEKSTP